MAFRGTRNDLGRPKGVSNKVTTKIRDAFSKLIEDNLEGLDSDLKSLKHSERIKFIIDLASFILPKMKALEVTNNDVSENHNELINKLIKIPDADFKKVYDE
jgi:hypothetical protein